VTLGRIEKMSKSKKNVIGLQEVSENYGMDASRLLVLSDSPPERDVEWTEGGIEGAWKYVNRLWRLVANYCHPERSEGSQAGNSARDPSASPQDDTDMRRKIHVSIHEVTQDFDRFHFNKAIARIREFSNALEDFKGDAAVKREGIEALLKLMAPVMPHIAEELWALLGHDKMLVDTRWPVADQSLLANATVTMGIQVNGKLRATVTLPKDMDQKLAEKAALDEPAVQKAMEGKPARKVIVVPNRIINVVV